MRELFSFPNPVSEKAARTVADIRPRLRAAAENH
jgi:hypothetical protein